MSKVNLYDLLLDLNTNKLTVAQMTNIYNTYSDAKPIKKFSTLADAKRRTRLVIEDMIAKPAKTTKPRKLSISAVCRQLIKDGVEKTAALNILKTDHGLPESKFWYLDWNRNAMKRAGEI